LGCDGFHATEGYWVIGSRLRCCAAGAEGYVDACQGQRRCAELVGDAEANCIAAEGEVNDVAIGVAVRIGVADGSWCGNGRCGP
jgi:hypothetical protein